MTDLASLQAEIRAFNAEREWGTFHDPKNLALCLAAEVGELAAIYRWKTPAEASALADDPKSRARIAAEIGDVTIVLLTLCERTGIDLVQSARTKLQANAHKYPLAEARGRAEVP